MKTLAMRRHGKEYAITFEINHYLQNGNLYVGMLTREDNHPAMYGNLTVNLSVPCKANRAFIDVNNHGLGIIEWLLDNNLGHLTAREKVSGFCSYPEFEFDMDVLMQYIEGR